MPAPSRLREECLLRVAALQFRDGLRMNRLRLRRNVFRDQLFALGKDLAQRTRVQFPVWILRAIAIS